MTTTSLIIGFFIGAVLTYLFNKTNTVSKNAFQELSTKHYETITNLRLFEEKTKILQAGNDTLSNKINAKENEAVHLQTKATSLETYLRTSETKINELSQKLNAELDANKHLQNELIQYKQQIAELRANNNFITEKLTTQKTEIEELQKTAHLQFEKIANKLLEEKSTKFTETNKTNLEALLNPLKEDIGKFKARVEETHTEDTKQRVSLDERIKGLIDQTNKVSSEANNLATALKGKPQKRGNWGEMVLERILEMSGLTKDREYFVQGSIKDEEGNNLRPDVRINLPDQRIIMIDSKVSLVAYDHYTSTENPEEQKIYLTKHLEATHTHIEQLNHKNYDNLGSTLDFTMMFIPIEPAYLLTIQADPSIWAQAYEKRILLVSPTNLIACLKLFSDLWKRDYQSKNAMDIVKKGEALYDKFVGFTKTFEEIGNSIKASQDRYDKALGQLKDGRGNIINQAIQLKNLGLKSDKKVPGKWLPLNMDDSELEHNEEQ